MAWKRSPSIGSPTDLCRLAARVDVLCWLEFWQLSKAGARPSEPIMKLSEAVQWFLLNPADARTTDSEPDRMLHFFEREENGCVAISELVRPRL
jgi:hypothetical protein